MTNPLQFLMRVPVPWVFVLIYLVILGYLNWTVIPVEEARLNAVFQDEYEQYRSRVRRWV